MSARYIYKIRVDSVVGTDASGSSNVWAVDVCAVDQMVVTLVTEYTACGIYSLVPKLICSYEKDTSPLVRLPHSLLALTCCCCSAVEHQA